MSKLKSVLKSKKFWLIIIAVVFVILAIAIPIFKIYSDSDSKSKNLIEKEYVVSIINNSKWEANIYLKENYYECWRPFKRYVCSDKTHEITSIEFKDATLEELYSDIDFIGLSLEEALMLYFNIEAEDRLTVDATIFSTYELDDQAEENIIKSINKNDVNIEFIYQELNVIEETQANYYTITFDTDGGTPIDSVVIKNKDTLEKPNDPTKEGYTFLYWELDGEEYDFTTPITEELTLTAVWKENKTSSNNNSSNNTSNNISNNSNNNTTSSSKINLNNNISITEYHVNDGTMDCFYYMFVTNLKEAFPNADITKINNNPSEVDFWYTSDRQDYEVSLEEINEYLQNGTLKINTSSENNFKNILNKYKNGNYKGITNVSYTEENHRFSFSYDYISFNGLNVTSNGETANKEIQNALSSSTKFNGPCGSASNYENKILTEELCNKYNLDCDRW
mgnify:CR=1 FL=1